MNSFKSYLFPYLGSIQVTVCGVAQSRTWLKQLCSSSSSRSSTPRPPEDMLVSLFPTVFFVVCAWSVTKLCPTLCEPVDCSLPGSSVYGISQARILEWIAISFSKGSLTQGLNLNLLDYRWIVYPLSHQGPLPFKAVKLAPKSISLCVTATLWSSIFP